MGDNFRKWHELAEKLVKSDRPLDGYIQDIAVALRDAYKEGWLAGSQAGWMARDTADKDPK